MFVDFKNTAYTLDEISLILNGNYNCNHGKIDSIRFDIKMLSFYIYFL